MSPPRCIHGQPFPCLQCEANRRWNAAATGHDLTEEEFQARYILGPGNPRRPVRPAPPKVEPGTFTHVGARSYVGRYAVTADAYRTPGKSHALVAVPGRPGVYRGLCGTTVHEGPSGDHFLPDNKPVPAAEGRVRCKCCLKRIAAMSR